MTAVVFVTEAEVVVAAATAVLTMVETMEITTMEIAPRVQIGGKKIKFAQQ